MASNNVQTTVHVGMDVQLAKRNAEALKEVIATLKKELKEARTILEHPGSTAEIDRATEAVKRLTLQIQTLQKVQKSATPAAAYESFISGDRQNSNTLRQAQRGAKNRLNTVRYGEGDAEARRFINDTNAIQRQLNRLQAGFTSPFRTIRQELSQLSGGELQRLHQLLQQEQVMVKGNDRAWANYSEAIAKVEQRIREYDTTARQQMGASTLSKAQAGGFATANERDMQRAIDKLKEYRAVINDPSGSGKATYEATNAEINKLQASLDALKQKTMEASGESMSLANALRTGMQTLNGTFTGTTQQLNLAKKALEANLLTAKRGSVEYDSIRRALNGVELELQRVGSLSQEVQAVLDSPKGKSFNALKQAVEQGRQALNSMDRTTKEGQKAFDDLAKKVKAADLEMKQLAGTSKASLSAFEKAWSRLKTYVGLYVGAAVAMQKLTATMGDLMELSDKMGEVRKTTGFTADEVGRLTTSLKKLDTRTPIVGLMELSSIAGSIGLKTQQDVEGFTIAANKLMVALPEMGSEAARTLIKIADATGDLKKNEGDVEQTLEKVGSTIIALRANSAAAAGPITDFVSRVGAVGAQAGISIDQIAALGATVDALGGRVEMSATALSRMIPAIKNNTFAVASALKMTESELKGMTGMEQMVTIFRKLHDSVKQFDTSTDEGMNAMADKVEQMLGNSASMQEVMKTLNQQGSRAGIVFGLLSQNVDKLEEQLDIAGKAYKENTALMAEYNNMNETTAAKWERLKNQLEEAFVSDRMQRWLGDIIDFLRVLVDLLTEDGPIGSFFRWSLVYLALWRAKWTEAIGTALISVGKFLLGTKASTAATVADTAAKTANTAATVAQAAATEAATAKTNMFASAWGKLNKVQRANVIAAVATALAALGWHLYEVSRKAREAAKQMNVMADVEKKAKDESIKERAELEKLYKVTQDQTASMEERRKALRDMVGDAKYKQYYENLTSEKELATAAAGAYKELAEQILAAARARAIESKAQELQEQRLKLEDQRKEREDWENKNRAAYQQGKNAYQQQQDYVEDVTGGWTAGFQESQIAQQGAAKMKPAIIDEFEGSIREKNRIDTEIGQIDKDLDKLKEQIRKINPQGTGDNGDGDPGGGGGGGNNLYGNYDKVTSPYSDWDANALVARRKEMLERVKALANGADVQVVLSEDAKFISDAVRKNITTTEQAIEWYNQERLKIQEALHGKNLTNTGDWMDPKKGSKKASKMVQDEMKYYLDELDAYFTERKAKIQEDLNDGQISEAEAWNRTLKNEAEWYQRRGNLQKLYSQRRKEVAQDERDAIFGILSERTGDSTDYIQKDIANTVKFIEQVGSEKGKAAMDKIYGDIDLGMERSFLKTRNAIGKQVQAIADIIDKENPFSGIVKSLQKNLGEMDLLLTDIKDAEQRTVDEETKRTMFILEQSTKGYALTWEEMMSEMAKRGWAAWAKEIEASPQMQERLMHQTYRVFEKVQDAIKKEASELKKQADIMWSNILMPGGDGKTTVKDAFEQAISALGIEQGRVSRANSLIGAGAASDRVADRLAIKQMQVQLAMQRYQYNLVRKIAKEKIDSLRREADAAEALNDMESARAKRMQADNAQQALNLATRKEQTEELKLQEDIIAKTEESQNRLYTALTEWGDLLASSLQSIFEASNAGNAEYYNELAKLNLTGKGGPGAGTYIVIDNEGTEDAKAHYEYLDERQALERQHEIEQENARAEAWRKVMDDLNQKMNDQITDWLNASFQNMSIDANTDATIKNTEALMDVANAMGGKDGVKLDTSVASSLGAEPGISPNPTIERIGYENETPATTAPATTDSTPSVFLDPNNVGLIWEQQAAAAEASAERQVGAIDKVKTALDSQFHKQSQGSKNANQQMTTSTQSAFAKMTQAANLYGIAYQVMQNDNLSASQKFGLMAVQAAGQAAITSLTVDFASTTAQTAADTPSVLSKLYKQLGWGAIPVFAVFTGLLGGLLGLAASKIAKSKSQIAQATGASGASAGRLATGMLTYAEGNVNEFTDPATLTPGRQYNVDAADGRTYRARYMGSNPRTHITNGPEFHLSGERGREMIIDAGTTRQITMNEAGIWQAIQTLSAGGRVRRASAARRRGVAAFADGNLDDFDDTMLDGPAVESGMGGMTTEQMAAFQTSLDRNNELLERALSQGFKAIVSPYGPDGIVNGYDKYKKEALRQGVKY
ncbi:MAG: phage tail tape measure protein [Prevotella sp.]|nr:phage tail tape measure protein [Prevotella sp.]